MLRPRGSELGDVCVWVGAGLLTYRLCDRDYDCDHCPLDFALRGQDGSLTGRQLVPSAGPADFPNDRSYTRGHTWIRSADRPGETRGIRCGLDLFATTIIGCCSRVECHPHSGPFERGAAICDIDIDLGNLTIGAPTSGCNSRCNPLLQEDPGSLLRAPYDTGWIVEFTIEDESAPSTLLDAPSARQQSQFDLLHFRRRLALQTLGEDRHRLGPLAADGGQLVPDLRQMIGGAAYAEILRELIY